MAPSSGSSQDSTTPQNDPADLITIHALILLGNVVDDDPGSRAYVNECRRQLLAAGADPTIETPRCCSLFSILISTRSKVIRTLFHSDLCSNISKESLAVLLNHGFEFLACSSEVDIRLTVSWVLSRRVWMFDWIAFLLQMSGSILPFQDLTHSLPIAILGSLHESRAGILKVLILLIKAGADLSTHGEFVSMIACNPRGTYFSHDELEQVQNVFNGY